MLCHFSLWTHGFSLSGARVRKKFTRDYLVCALAKSFTTCHWEWWVVLTMKSARCLYFKYRRSTFLLKEFIMWLTFRRNIIRLSQWRHRRKLTSAKAFTTSHNFHKLTRLWTRKMTSICQRQCGYNVVELYFIKIPFQRHIIDKVIFLSNQFCFILACADI